MIRSRGRAFSLTDDSLSVMTDIPHTPDEAAPVDLPFPAELLDDTLNQRMGVQLLEISPQRAVGRMPVAGNTQPAGLLHGGASAALAETLASIAATAHAGPGRAAVGMDLNATHHRGVRQGWVTGTATALHLGRRTAAYEIVLEDESGRRVCTCRLTCMLVESR